MREVDTRPEINSTKEMSGTEACRSLRNSGINEVLILKHAAMITFNRNRAMRSFDAKYQPPRIYF